MIVVVAAVEDDVSWTSRFPSLVTDDEVVAEDEA